MRAELLMEKAIDGEWKILIYIRHSHTGKGSVCSALHAWKGALHLGLRQLDDGKNHFLNIS